MEPKHPDETRSPRTVIPPDGEAGAPVPGAGTLGMWLFLGSLAMLFAANLVGYLVVRLRADEWQPEGAPGLPAGLWVSTVVILCCSATMHWALTGIRKGRRETLVTGLAITLALGIAFLILQALNWRQLIEREVTAASDLFGYTFFMLTGLHALHVIGGLVPLAFVLVKAIRGRYNWASYAGVRQVAMYWHFLDIVWLILFAALMI